MVGNATIKGTDQSIMPDKAGQPTGQDPRELQQALVEVSLRLERRVRELEALVTVTERINRGLLLDEVLDEIYDAFRPIIPYDRIGVALLEEDDRGRKMVRSQWMRSDNQAAHIGPGYAAPLAGSSLETILDTGEPRIINDLQAHLLHHPKSRSTQQILKDGVRSSLTCPLVAAGRPVGFIFFSSNTPNTYRNAHVATFQQIAGQLAMILEKSRLYQRLMELNELKNRFLGVAAHDLRNPLGVLGGYVDLLRQEALGPLNEAQQEVMAVMADVTGRMSGLVDDLLDVSAIESGRLELEREPLDLNRFLREQAHSQGLIAQGKAIRIALELPEPLPSVAADGQRLGQVIDNLIANAIKFSPRDTVITLAGSADEDWVQISVSDQGPGVPAEERERLFEPFQRGSNTPTADEQSTGLGLSIVQKLVQAHGGRVHVDEAPGGGARFTVQLPCDAGTDAQPPEQEPHA